MQPKTYINIHHAEIEIPLQNFHLKGILTIPPKAKGIVVFAHGSGSGRLSSRNQFVAQELQKGEIATLLIDLLTEEEDLIDQRTSEFRFNIPLLAERLSKTADWLKNNQNTQKLKIGLYGASTGAAAALISAAAHAHLIYAVVSRGGRTDLAEAVVENVLAPTLFIVGSHDPIILELNQKTFAKLRCEKQIEIIPMAGHLFEEPGTLEQVAELSKRWFTNHVTS